MDIPILNHMSKNMLAVTIGWFMLAMAKYQMFAVSETRSHDKVINFLVTVK